ncbi:ATP-grasp domain-containing protein [Streptomyces sp. NRRL F-5755]|uniref:ATP-grasp domain-containing protein n=1 Tax=Streptomyces sp. NRRL F-5755 TaxID=1519475 RepID=UPI0006AEFDEC|nr:ATP-grasp domain-containing protein [Streptomyces sp. NRRL F-5755]
MTAAPKAPLVIADAPGGPHPSLYLPSLLDEFDVHVVWLDVEANTPRQRRVAALQAAEEAGGSLTAVPAPQEVHQALSEVVTRTRAAGVLAFSERVVHIAQRVAHDAGLPANPPHVLDALQDKRLQRTRLRDSGLPTPGVAELHCEEDLRRAAATCSFPAVLKPSVGMGSTATFRVDHPGLLEDTWQRARELALADGRIAHHHPVMLLEEELTGDPRHAEGGLGDYLSVEALVVDGVLHVLAVSDKLPLSPPYRENGHILPALRPASGTAAAVAHVRDAHRALGIRFGATHTEVKLTPDGPRVIEVNGRVGGSVPEQLLLVAGYDLPLNLARLSVGRRPDTDANCRRWSAYLTPQPPDGRHRIEVAPTPEALRAVPGIRSVHHVAARNCVVDSADGTASNLVRVVAAVDSPQEIFALAERLAGPEMFKLRPEGTGGDSQ